MSPDIRISSRWCPTSLHFLKWFVSSSDVPSMCFHSRTRQRERPPPLWNQPSAPWWYHWPMFDFRSNCMLEMLLYSTIGSERNIWWTCLRGQGSDVFLLGGWLFVPNRIPSGDYTFWDYTFWRCWFSHFPMTLPVQGTVNGAIDSFDKVHLQKTCERLGNPAFLEASKSSLHGHLKQPFA